MFDLSVLGWVALGGALGAVLRVVATRAVSRRQGDDFPFGTLWVNYSGALVGGLLIGFGLSMTGFDHGFEAFWLFGLVGSYTTVSTLGLEWLELVRRDRLAKAMTYLGASLIGGVVLALAGILAGLGLSSLVR